MIIPLAAGDCEARSGTRCLTAPRSRTRHLPHTCTAHRVDTVVMRSDARTPDPQYTHPAQIECGPHPTETVHVHVQLALTVTNNNSRSTTAGPVDAWRRSPDGRASGTLLPPILITAAHAVRACSVSYANCDQASPLSCPRPRMCSPWPPLAAWPPFACLLPPPSAPRPPFDWPLPSNSGEWPPHWSTLPAPTPDA